MDPTLRAEHVEEGYRGLGQDLQSDRLTLDRRRLDTRRAGRNARLPLAEPFERLADLQRCLRRLRPPKFARTEGIVLLVGQLRIEQGSGLDALTRRDADVPLGRGETGARGKRPTERIPHGEGLGMRVTGEPWADQKCRCTRKMRDRFAKHRIT